MAKVNLSSPWVIYYKELEALFKGDPNVKVIFDELENTIKLYVQGESKAEALSQLLPTEKEFGNVTIKIEVLPANEFFQSAISLYEDAFRGNSALRFVKNITNGVYSFDYIVFKPEVVQFFNDSLGDINGNCSTLYQNIAKDIFGETDGVFFCTDEVK